MISRQIEDRRRGLNLNRRSGKFHNLGKPLFGNRVGNRFLSQYDTQYDLRLVLPPLEMSTHNSLIQVIVCRFGQSNRRRDTTAHVRNIATSGRSELFTRNIEKSPKDRLQQSGTVVNISATRSAPHPLRRPLLPLVSFFHVEP